MDPYTKLLADLFAFVPPVHIFGGFAEDALLHGRTQRPHDDVDVLVGRHELDAQLDNVRRLGFPKLSTRFEAVPGRPFVMGALHGGLDLELSVYDVTADGHVWFNLLDPDGRLYELRLSDGVFDHPPSILDGMPVRTVSPLALYQIRAGITIVGGFGPPRPKDLVAQQALQARLLADIAPQDLLPMVR